MSLRTYRVEITGVQPLLMHADSIEWADEMDRWKAKADNRSKGKAGDDRAPAWRWLGSMYHDGEHLVLPTENVMRMLMEGGAMTPTGRKMGTFKSQSQSGIMPTAVAWPLSINGEQVPVASLVALAGNDDFAAHQEEAKRLGFSLFLKRARIGATKHIRVRPRFDQWEAAGELVVTDDMITTDVLSAILSTAGRYKGLGDWRPGGKTPGVYGMFEAKVSQIR